MMNEPRTTQLRIIWKFLSGIKVAGVRSEIIRQKWMKSESEAKSYEEVLKIAQQSKLNRLAAVATGTDGDKKGVQGKVASAPFMKVKERREADRSRRTPHTSSDSSRSSAITNSLTSADSGASRGGNQGNFLCHYCKTQNHFGGWRLCDKRLKENPSWIPKGFQ